MNIDGYELVEDEKFGFSRLEPIPSADTLSSFYQSEYPELLENGELAADVSRLLEDSGAAEREREWRRSTWYADYLHIVEQELPDCKSVLDVGAGTGEFLLFAEKQDYDAIGIEPSGRIGDVARDKGLEIHETTVETFVESHDAEFDLVTMFNVLEHVPNPGKVLDACRDLLTEDGMLILKVPNEFNPFQRAAQAALGLDRWWITVPTHIFYFDFDSLAALLTNHGFNIHARLADFPMSQFLLMGHNYITDDDIGGDCHERRVRFELAIDDEARREFYKRLADAGLGRNCTLFATVE